MLKRPLCAIAALSGLAQLLGGCMSGRSSLLATPAARGAEVAPTTGAAASPPLAGSHPAGPPRSSQNLLASSGAGAGRMVLTLRASAADVGGLHLSSGISASTAPVVAAGRTAVSIAPTLAPAASVGASVAAVTQPLTASASIRAKAGLKAVAKGLAVKPQPGLGVSVRVGG